MGNICFPSSSSSSSAIKHGELLRVVKTDVKTKPVLVKDLLMKISPGYRIGSSRKPLKVLPQDYKLKIGYVSYLIPAASSTMTTGDSPAATTKSSVTVGVTRIKLILTRQELQNLLSNEISEGEISMLDVIKKDNDDAWCGINPSSRWKPVLETIPEGSE